MEGVIWAGMTAGTAVFANSAPPESLKDVAARIAHDVPLLLIHADHGGGGEELTAEYGAAAAPNTPTTVWEIPESGHTQGIEARPAEYEQRVIGFLDAALLGR